MEECKQLIDRFDKNRDGELDRAEFEAMLLPTDPVTAGQLKRRVAFNRDRYYSPKLVSWIINQVFTRRTELLLADVIMA